MTISKVNPSGFGVNSLLSSAQMNAFDTKIITALDKTTAGDTLAGAITVASGGSITLAAGATLSAPSTSYVALTLGVGAVINANAVGVIGSNAASAIYSAAAGGIRSSFVGGIDTNVAGGISSGVAGGINLAGGVNDYPTFPARPRTIVQPCDVCAGVSVTSGGALNPALNGVASPFSPAAGVAYFIESGTMRTNSIVNTNSVGGSSYYFPLRSLHHGATLGSAVLSFTPSAHASLPSYQQPSFGIYRTPAAYSGGPVGLLSTSFVTLAAATVGAYNAPQTLTFTPNQNSVIDTTQYIYFAIVWDEAGASGALIGNRFASIAMNYTGITDMRFQ